METLRAYIPIIDGEPAINAVGATESECHVNLAFIDLDDDQLQRVKVVGCEIQIPDEV